jgi:hypothetical protein
MNGILALFFFDVCAWHAGHHRTGRQGSVDFPEAKGGMRIHKCSTWLSIFPKLPEPCQILLLADTLTQEMRGWLSKRRQRRLGISVNNFNGRDKRELALYQVSLIMTDRPSLGFRWI